MYRIHINEHKYLRICVCMLYRFVVKLSSRPLMASVSFWLTARTPRSLPGVVIRKWISRYSGRTRVMTIVSLNFRGVFVCCDWHRRRGRGLAGIRFRSCQTGCVVVRGRRVYDNCGVSCGLTSGLSGSPTQHRTRRGLSSVT